MNADELFPKMGPAEQGDKWAQSNAVKDKANQYKATINEGRGPVPGKMSKS